MNKFNKYCFSLIIGILQVSCSQAQNPTPVSDTEQEIAKLEKQKTTIDIQINDLRCKKIKEDLQAIGLPQTAPNVPNEIVEHSALFLGYNEQHEQANWVAHIVLPQINTTSLKRTNDFRVDEKVKTGSANQEDYKRSGYDRGHMAPSADFRWYKKAMSDSYLYSNMSPQKRALNGRKWNDLEQWVRQYVANQNKQLVVITGPWLEDDLPKISQGSQRVSIPRYYYKIILDTEGEELKAIGFLLPNNPCHESLSAYAVTIDYIEEKTGLDFFAKLEDSLETKLEANFNFNAWQPYNDKKIKQNNQNAIATIKATDRPKGSITTLEAINYYGKNAIVCGTVISTHKAKKGRVYLNLDGVYPKQPFSVTIPADIAAKWSGEPHLLLKNKKVCVSADIYEYKGKPTTTIKRKEQINILK